MFKSNWVILFNVIFFIFSGESNKNFFLKFNFLPLKIFLKNNKINFSKKKIKQITKKIFSFFCLAGLFNLICLVKKF